MKTAEKLPTKDFELYQGSELIMRLGLGMTLFVPRPFSTVREPMWGLWQDFLRLVGKEKLTWARLGGGNRSRAVTASTFRTIEAWLTGKKDYGKDCWISIHDGPMDCLGQYGFELEGLGEPVEDEEDVGFVDMGFPVEMLDTLGGPALADRLIALAAQVPFYCGVAGYIFSRSSYKFDAVIRQMAGLSRRFEGVEITASDREQYWAGKGLVSVNWVTFIGDPYLAELGGIKGLTEKLPAGCVVTPLAHGVAVRAGDVPLLGDKNTGKDELELWRKVYKVLKPVQFVDPIYEFDPFVFDGDRTAEWLQRLEK
jgi:hypothetical protein